MVRLQNEHSAQLLSTDEAPRVSARSGQSIIKVRGCRHYREQAEPLIRDDARTLFGAQVRRLV